VGSIGAFQHDEVTVGRIAGKALVRASSAHCKLARPKAGKETEALAARAQCSVGRSPYESHERQKPRGKLLSKSSHIDGSRPVAITK